MITEELLPQGVAAVAGSAGVRPSLKLYGGGA